MVGGPPFEKPQSEEYQDGPSTLEEYAAWMRPLDYPNREIYIWQDEWGERGGDEIPFVADLDPEPHDPDPEIWPIEEIDPGYPAPVDDLVREFSTYPEPHVCWITPEYFEEIHGFGPERKDLKENKNVQQAYRDKIKEKQHEILEAKLERGVDKGKAMQEANEEAYSYFTQDNQQKQLELTEDRRIALTRIANIWNGKQVEGCHILLDKCPKWDDFLGDLNQTELKRLLIDPDIDYDIYELFSNHEWYTEEPQTYLEPQYVAQKKIYWNLNQRGKTLLIEHEDFPTLHGDTFERLRHRFTVGMVALWFSLETGDSEAIVPYPRFKSLDGTPKADIAVERNNSEFFNGDLVVCETLTGHNDRNNWDNTLAKLYRLNKIDGVRPIISAPQRSTIYDAIRYWEKNGDISFPTTGFNTDWNIEKGRSKTREAYEHSDHWPIADWTTALRLWRDLLADGGREARRTALSLSW
jgi:hypothetical protein